MTPGEWLKITKRRRVYVPSFCLAVDPYCSLLPIVAVVQKGYCGCCSAKLEGRRTKWCSDACAGDLVHRFLRQHDWKFARGAAMARDKFTCVRCGTAEELTRVVRNGWGGTAVRSNLEVNHIVPRNGGGYGRGCHHHLSNLETLCGPCHRTETNRQREERRQQATNVRPLRSPNRAERRE